VNDVTAALTRFVTAVPASVKLVYRLARDPRIERKHRVAAGAALAYAVLPFDLIPDRIKVLGKVDDAAVVVVALTRLVEAAGPDLVREHWDADPESLETLLGLLSTAEQFVPRRLRLGAATP
jgi:uncharacterized membrane protein YkvA (DUF1232 family)